MSHGALQTLAIFDKPDPLEGPFFEETIYVTPSRAGHDVQQAVEGAVSAAAQAIGLSHGPIHAECRVNATGVYVLEVAARPIGGLCAKALRFERGGDPPDTCSLEELLLRHAAGRARARLDARIAGVGRDDDSHPEGRGVSRGGGRRRGHGRARRGRRGDHRQARSAAGSHSRGRQLPGLHLRPRRHAGRGRGCGAPGPRAAALRHRSVDTVWNPA